MTVRTIGIVDVMYTKHGTGLPTTDRKQMHKVVSTCPYYRKWNSMLTRCYSSTYKLKYPTYQGCCVCDSWLLLSNFILWVDAQPNTTWIYCHLDKDLLGDGITYNPKNCCFITKELNLFLTDNKRCRGEYMLGVNLDKESNKFRARCSNPFTKRSTYLGRFTSELEAHKAWQAKKHEYACQLADLQEDPRVAEALRQRYAPDKDWTNN